MAKIKYDVSEVETGGQKRLPAPAVYDFKIESAEITKPEGKDQRIEIKFVAQGRKWKGYAGVWEYVNLESPAAAWKLRELLEAVGLVKPGAKTKKDASGSLDTDDLVGEVIKGSLKPDTYNGEPSPKMGKMMPKDAESEDDDDDDDDDDEPETEAGDDEGEEEVDLDEMDLDELTEYAEELDLDVDEIIGRSKGERAAKKLRAAIEEASEEDDDDDDEEEEETPAYDEWELADLKKELKNRGLRTTGKKAQLVARLEADDEDDDESGL